MEIDALDEVIMKVRSKSRMIGLLKLLSKILSVLTLKQKRGLEYRLVYIVSNF